MFQPKNNTLFFFTAAPQQCYSFICIMGFNQNTLDPTLLYSWFVTKRGKKNSNSRAGLNDDVEQTSLLNIRPALDRLRFRLHSLFVYVYWLSVSFVGISGDKQQRSPLTATSELHSHVLITLMVLGIIDLRCNFISHVVIARVCFYANG